MGVSIVWALTQGIPAPPARASEAFPFSFGSVGQEYGKALAVGAGNDVIVAALFQNDVDVAPGDAVTTLAGIGLVDIGLIRYNKDGGLVWGEAIGGAASTDVPHAVDTDNAGNILLAGYFGSQADANPRTADFDPGPAVRNLTSQGNFDAFVAKYDADGAYLWALGLGNSAGATEERIWDLIVDADNACYVTGAFSGTLDFNPLQPGNPRVLTAEGAGVNLFLAKYDSAGSNLWAIRVGANLTDVFTEAYGAVAVDEAGNCFWSGNFRDANVDFDPGPGTALLGSAGQTDIFLARYAAADGAFGSAARIGGVARDIASPGALRLDQNGNPLLTGRFSGVADFDPGAGTRNLTAISAMNAFVAAYTSGSALRWAFSIPATGDSNGGHRVAVDRANNVLVAGWFSGDADFDPSPATANLTSNGTGGASDVFLAKYDNAGAYQWAFGCGAAVSGGGNLSIAAGLDVDGADNSIITGQFFGANADFDPAPGNSIFLSSEGANDCFVAKYTPAGQRWTFDVPVRLSSWLLY